MISRLIELDKEVSVRIHFQNQKLFNIWYYFFARIFSSDRFFWSIGMIYCVSSYRIMMEYIIGIIVTTLAITSIKYLTNRDRPDADQLIPQIRIHHQIIKTDSLRKGEHLKSFPSGDSAQAGLYTCFLIQVIQNSQYLNQQQKMMCYFLALMLCLNVMVARIYYLCHYLLDTVVGSLIGFVMGLIVIKYYSI